MNVSLTPEFETLVEREVSSGRYSSASEVVQQALQLLRNHQMDRQAQINEFRAEAHWRLAQLDRGEVVDGETVFAGLRQKAQKRLGSRG